jgi:hypothetical protein
MASIWDNIKNVHKGSWGGLPDFGVTEALASGISSIQGNTPLQSSQGGSNLLGDINRVPGSTTLQGGYTAGASTTGPAYSTGPAPSTGTGPVPSARPTQAPQQPNDGFDMSLYPGWDEKAARADYAATGGPSGGGGGPSRQEVEASLSQQYDPVFSELDRRLGLLPEQRNELNQQVTDLEAYQRGEAERGRESQESQLGEFRAQEETKSKRTLDEYSTDLADVLRRVGGIYGGSSGAEVKLEIQRSVILT